MKERLLIIELGINKELVEEPFIRKIRGFKKPNNSPEGSYAASRPS